MHIVKCNSVTRTCVIVRKKFTLLKTCRYIMVFKATGGGSVQTCTSHDW